MWRKTYFLLALIRLYFALSPSYIHPDEHFQGPEVIAGEVFGWPIHQTWEFTSSKPVRSLFPLWLVYGWPLTVFKLIWEGLGYGDDHNVPPLLAFYVLRALMFTLSFVLEDWALHELLPLARERRTAILLVASSYVTWTCQTHTFSNSIETLVVLWCIVLIRRVRDDREHTQATACAVLAFLGVLGVFNRITFPAFLLLPSLLLVPHLLSKPLSVLIMALAGLATVFVAVWTDTQFYTRTPLRLRNLHTHAVITPLNNLLYNLDATNLAQHGLHPFWQHFGANLPQLLGPAFPLLFFSSTNKHNLFFWTGMTGTALLSCFAHQEARFLLPAVPLFLPSISIPRRMPRLWIGNWILFNALAALVFGIYHQGGIVPTQTWLSTQHGIAGQAFWWKTYSPPRWLLDGRAAEIETIDLMGVPGQAMIKRVSAAAAVCDPHNQTLLVAPSSASFLDAYTGVAREPVGVGVKFEQLWHYRQHLTLDDMDFGDDGFRATLERVIGRRGLTVWRVHGQC